jgi:hypothetical protein
MISAPIQCTVGPSFYNALSYLSITDHFCYFPQPPKRNSKKRARSKTASISDAALLSDEQLDELRTNFQSGLKKGQGAFVLFCLNFPSQSRRMDGSLRRH